MIPFNIIEQMILALEKELGKGYTLNGEIVHHEDDEYTIEAWDLQDKEGEVDEDKAETAGIILSEQFFDPLVETMINYEKFNGEHGELPFTIKW